MKDTKKGQGESGPKPSDLDGQGYSDASYNPGYPLDTSLPDVTKDDMKRGFKKGG